MTEPVLRARELTKHYPVGGMLPRGIVRALVDVSFELGPKRTLAVVGESGCGKSTLARQLTLIERPTSGSLQIDGIEAGSASRAELRILRPRIQMVFQNPYASLNPRKTVAQTLDEPLRLNSREDSATRRRRVVHMLEEVGLSPDHLGRYPHMFSGGQRQRIAIARAMILHPKIVIADEPVSALDVSIQAQILNLFMDLQEHLGTAYVFISHNLSVIEHVAHDVMVMYLGRIVEQGRKEDIFRAPLHPYTQVLLAATPSIEPGSRRRSIPIRGELPSPLNPPAGCAFHTRCPIASERCRRELPALEERQGRHVACHHPQRL